MAMFTAYFDESGTSRDPHALTVAGSISSVRKWLHFERKWREILARNGVTVFHMAECARATGEYKGWSTERRKELIADLTGCMARYVKRGFSVTVHLGDWRAMDQRFELSEKLTSPYVYAGRLCVLAARRWIHDSKVEAEVRYVFEDGADDKGKLLDVLSQRDNVKPIFESKEVPGLQLADLIAWKNRRIVHDLISRPFTMTEQEFLDSFAAIRTIPCDYSAVEEGTLTRACTRFRIPRRGHQH